MPKADIPLGAPVVSLVNPNIDWCNNLSLPPSPVFMPKADMLPGATVVVCGKSCNSHFPAFPAVTLHSSLN
jgi:hypothetical protein